MPELSRPTTPDQPVTDTGNQNGAHNPSRKRQHGDEKKRLVFTNSPDNQSSTSTSTPTPTSNS